MVEKALKIKSMILAKRPRGLALAALRKTKIETLNALMMLGIVMLVVLYFFTTNNVAMANYSKTSLQKSVESLRIEIHNLNLELTDKRSIGFLKKAAEDLNLVVNESIQYIKVAGPVALDSSLTR